MFQTVFIILAVLAAPASRNRKPAFVRTYLLYRLVLYVGLMGLLTARAHV